MMLAATVREVKSLRELPENFSWKWLKSARVPILRPLSFQLVILEKLAFDKLWGEAVVGRIS